jgi:protease IV
MQDPRHRAGAASALAAMLLVGCVTINVGAGRREGLVEKVVYGTKGPKILMIDVDGMITDQDSPGALGVGSRESTVSRVREQLDRASDEGVRAIVLRINTPGGSVGGSDVVYSEIRRFKKEQQVPVVAALMGLATSGGYYVASAADVIVAQPTTVTGSIGVVMMGVSVAGLMEKLGIEDQTLTTGPFKDAGSPLERLTPEQRAQLQGVLDDLHARFVAVVLAGRPALTRAQVENLADGRVMSAPQALQAGLVDSIGDLPRAIGEAERRAGLERSRVVVYQRPGDGGSNLYAMDEVTPSAQTPWSALLGGTRPAFAYLWWPW